MELNGFNFDVLRADEIITEQDSLLRDLEIEAEGIFGYDKLNLGSSQQLSALLYGGLLTRKWREWKIKEMTSQPYSYYKEYPMNHSSRIDGLGFKPLPKTKRMDGYYKTDKATISQLTAKTPEQKRIKALLADYGQAKKVKETLRGLGNKGLVNKICKDGKIHPNLNQTVTTTGRLSSSDPNSQNMPRGSTSPIKECIIPTFDGIMQVDLSQIEWRAAAELSGDEVMISEVNADVDQHTETCTRKDMMNKPLTKENRTDAKIFNFRMIYGGTAYGYYMDIKMPDFALKKWERICTAFYNKYKGLKQWQDSNVIEVEKRGVLRIPTGRMFVFHKSLRKGGINVFNERQVKNYPVQGIAGGDILPLIAVQIRRGLRAWGLKSKLILTVHDSIVFDYIDSECERLCKLLLAILKTARESVAGYFEIPWRCKIDGEIEIGPNYGSLKGYAKSNV